MDGGGVNFDEQQISRWQPVGLTPTRYPWENRNNDSHSPGYPPVSNCRPTDRLTG